MSGDVQPRKRKDKRRRRDEDEAGLPISSGRSGSTDHSDNVAIHIHKESSTGGHWCAKIIFFALLVALVGVVGLIIVEHRGSTDVDTPVSASQWAMLFDGWVDDNTATHEEEVESHHLADESHEHEDHDEDEQEQDAEVDEHEIEEDEKQASPEEQSDDEKNQLDDDEEEEDEQPEEEEEEGEDEIEQAEEENEEERGEEEEEENEGPGGITGIDDYNEDTDADADADIDDGYFKPHNDDDDEIEPALDRTISEEDVDENHSKEEENDDYAERPFDYASTEKENGYHNVYDDFGALDEIEDDADEDEKDEINDPYDIDLDLSIEGIIPKKDSKDLASADEDTDFLNMSGEDIIDDNSAEPLEEIDDGEPEEIINEVNIEDKEEKEEEVEKELEEESTSVAMKFGVGVALIVTAHFVLVRRWNNGEPDNPEILNGSDEVPDLTRRNTIVAPSRIKEVIRVPEDEQQQLDKEQEKTYNELHSAYKKVGSTDKKRSGIEEIFAKKTADLELMLRGATKAKNNDPRERADEDSDIGEDNDEENSEDEEMEDDDIIDDFDDVDLIEKLDKKYGKLPTSSYDGDEQEDNELDETEEEEEEEEEGELEEDELQEDELEEDEGEEEEDEEELDEEEEDPERYKSTYHGPSEKHVGSSVKQASNQKRIWADPSKTKSKGEQSYDFVGNSYDDHVEESITRF